MWYHRKIGGERCPIVDTWWQTETGGIMMSPLPGAIATKPGSCTKPLPGVVPVILDDQHKPVAKNTGGMLCIAQPWPGMLRGIWGDDARYVQQYWTKVPHHYLTGDNARQDNDGYYWIMGRIDDVIKVSGHRLSTIEVESALVSHPLVAEAAAVGRPHEIKGEAISVFVTLKGGESLDVADFARRPIKYMYADATHRHFLDQQDYNQYSLPLEDVAEEAQYLTEELEGVMALIYNDECIGVEVPQTVVLKVTQCDPGVKGNSATGRTKPATLETGLVVSVPEYLSEGELIKIDTRTAEFLSRA